MAVAALCLTTGCGNFWVYPGSTTGGTGATGTGDYVYVANATAQNVAGFEVGTGVLTPLSGSPYALGYVPTAAVVNPADSILFVASNSGIYNYSIASTGVLASLNSGVTSGLEDVVSLAVSPDGQWLFALDGAPLADVLTVYQFQISSTGALSADTSSGATYTGTYTITAAASPIVPPQAYAIQVATVSSGEYVFVALGTGGTLVIPFNTSSGAQFTTTALQYAVPTSSPSSPYYSNVALAVNSSTSVLYVATSNASSGPGLLTAYTIGSNGTSGTLTTLATNATANFPTAVVLNSAGTDVYVANESSESISGFSTTVSGSTLPALTSSPYSFTYAPTGLAVDRSGDYLLAISSTGTPNLAMYSYDATTAGELDEAASTATGTNPVAIATTH
jgi:6-phosphogluconolactonase (cycloisomerase 2 family)